MAELDNWLKVIELTGLTGWSSFYESSLGHPVSNIQQLTDAIEDYGEWPVFDAVVASSKKKFTTDPLSYVLAVAQSKWKEQHMINTEDAKYQRGLERAKNRIKEQNEELEAKLEKARRLVED